MDRQQTFAVRIGKGTQEKLIDDGEDGCIPTDAERKGEDNCHRESRRAAQGATRVPDVAHQVLDERSAADVVSFLLEPKTVTKPAASGLLGVGLAHAGAQILAGQQLEMEGHLPIHVAIARAPREKRDQTSDGTGDRTAHLRLRARGRATPA